ncbi:MAG: protein kinase [Verrucomicrobiae bacterium]|nr:protein kinase [Verrucomicrobiae bacterium]
MIRTAFPDTLNTGMHSDDHQENRKALAPGRRLFNRYVLKSVAGRGGMGVVWCAWDERLQHHVALKFLPEVILDDPIALEDLRKETKRCLNLTHPNIVRIYDFEEDGETGAIVMEFVKGQPLNVLKAAQPDRHFEVAQLHPLVLQLCDTLTYAHNDAGFVHRDVKPANLLLTETNQLKVTDFGIARNITDSVSRLSVRSNDSSGTPGYMSPQQAMGEKASIADDIYSVGATLFDLLTSRPPFFTGDIPMQILSKVPPAMAERRAELGVTGHLIPKAWEEVIAACLSKDQKARPRSVAELKNRLGDAQLAPPQDELDTIVLTQTPVVNRGVLPPSEPEPTRPPTSAPASEPSPPTSGETSATPASSGGKHTMLLVAVGLLGVIAISLVSVLYFVVKNMDASKQGDTVAALLKELQPLLNSAPEATSNERDQAFQNLQAEVEKLKQLQSEKDALLEKIATLEEESGKIQQSNTDKDQTLENLRSELDNVQQKLDDRPTPPVKDNDPDRSVEVAAMIIAYTAAGNTGSKESQIDFFDEKVDYLGEGILSKVQIAEDSKQYRKRFPRRTMTITEGPAVIRKQKVYQVTTTSHYEFDHFREGHRVTKTIGNTFDVRFSNGKPLITSISNPRNETIAKAALPATESVASDFVKAYFADGESHNGRAQLDYYADSVYYFGEVRTKQEISEDLDSYIASTPYRTFSLLSEPEVLVLGKEFQVTTTVKATSGDSADTARSRTLKSQIKVAWEGTSPKITSIQPVQ